MAITAGLPVTDPDNIAIANEFCIKAKNNDVAGMREFLHKHPGFNIGTPFKLGFTALHYACKNKSLEAAQFLIMLGADITQPALNEGRTTPLDLCKDVKKISESINKEISSFNRNMYMVRERENRVQLGDLKYKTELLFSKDEKYQEDIVTHMLYSITGNDFRLMIRAAKDEDIYDAVFDADSSGLIHIALTSAGLPSEYVNSRFLVATDIFFPENIEKLESFYDYPLNRYCEDEIIEKNWCKKNRKGNMIPLYSTDSSIKEKYFNYTPDGESVLTEKTDLESQIFFAGKARKTELCLQNDLIERHEILAKRARMSLQRSFTIGREIELAKDTLKKSTLDNNQQDTTLLFSEKKLQFENMMNRDVKDLDALIELLKKCQIKKDGQTLPTPELAFRRAAALGSIDMLDKLINLVKDLNINAPGLESGKTALDFAQATEKNQATQFLIRIGAKSGLFGHPIKSEKGSNLEI